MVFEHTSQNMSYCSMVRTPISKAMISQTQRDTEKLQRLYMQYQCIPMSHTYGVLNNCPTSKPLVYVVRQTQSAKRFMSRKDKLGQPPPLQSCTLSQIVIVPHTQYMSGCMCCTIHCTMVYYLTWADIAHKLHWLSHRDMRAAML